MVRCRLPKRDPAKAFNSETLQERQVATTPRVHEELSKLFQQGQRSRLVFGIKDNVKNAFNSARRIADLKDVRFHDLRHTAATRLVRGHMPISEVGRILGHTQVNTTYRYVNANIETARRAAHILASLSDPQRTSDEAQSSNRKELEGQDRLLTCH